MFVETWRFFIIFGLLLSSLSLGAGAADKNSKGSDEREGSATIAIKGGFFSKITDEERIVARRAAVLDAWKNYLDDASTNSIARLSILQANKAEIDAKLANCVTNPAQCDFISSIEFVRETLDEKNKTFKVFVTVSINDQRVTAFLNSKSSTASAASGSGSGFAFLFLQRNATSTKQTLEKRDGQAEVSESVELASTENSASANVKKSVGVEKSQTLVRDKSKYSADEGGGAEVLASVSAALVQFGYEATDVKTILEFCEKETVYAEAVDSFQQKGTVGNFADMVKNVRLCGSQQGQSFKYFGVLEADASAPYRERGKQIVNFKASIRVYNIEKGIPRIVNAVPPKQLPGEGVSTDAATRDGLIKVGAETSRVLIDVLTQRNLN